MSHEYSYDEILGFLRAAIAERGEDFVYEPRHRPDGATGCYYHWEGEADCGIGKMLHDHLSVPLDTLQKMDDASSGGISEQYGLLLQCGIAFDRRAKILMQHFQGNQDDGVPWGYALTEAVEAVEHFEN